MSVKILQKLKNCDPPIHNIMIFVCDSLRWDYLPDSVAYRGITFKTVASSLYTPCSFPSMVTGLYPPNHGVYSWRTDRISKKDLFLMNLDDYNFSLWNENTWLKCDPPESTPLHKILNYPPRIDLGEIKLPFIYLEDEKGGHAPFGWRFGDTQYEEWDAVRFFRDYGGKSKEELCIRYRDGIDRSVEFFEKRLDVLKHRGIINNTLVIFTSDHGEGLGEYGGHVGHGRTTCPEVVYVPTVFIHPSLPAGLNLAGDGIIRHVDLFPTILDILNIKLPRALDGISLVSAEQLPKFGFNNLVIKADDKFMGLRIRYDHSESSVWDKDGGHVFRESKPLVKLIHALRDVLLGVTGYYLRGGIRNKGPVKACRDYFRVFRYYNRSYIKHGTPSFIREDATAIINMIRNSERRRLIRGIDKLKRGARN